MRSIPEDLTPGSEINLLLPYVTDLEFEVERLRKHSRLVEHLTRDATRRIRQLCSEAAESSLSEIGEIGEIVDELASALGDLHEHPGFHPAHDQVVPIALRPLIDQVFRWQQRLESKSRIVLRTELEVEYVNWFPARLRHIIDNLLENALRYSARSVGESRVTIGLRRTAEGYELRVSDNGVGIPSPGIESLTLFHRAAPARSPGLGVGLAVVKTLVDQSGGTLTVESAEGQGTSFVAVLPRYDVDDFLDDDVPALAPQAG